MEARVGKMTVQALAQALDQAPVGSAASSGNISSLAPLQTPRQFQTATVTERGSTSQSHEVISTPRPLICLPADTNTCSSQAQPHDRFWLTSRVCSRSALLRARCPPPQGGRGKRVGLRSQNRSYAGLQHPGAVLASSAWTWNDTPESMRRGTRGKNDLTLRM